MKTAIVLLLLWCPVSFGQGTAFDKPAPALPTETGRKIADVASYVTIAALEGLELKTCLSSADRARCGELAGVRNGLAYGSAYLTKKIVRRDRPCAPACGVDSPDSSFFSAHTALAFTALGGSRLQVTLPLAIGTGALRIGANKHWLTDVITGALVGALTNKLTNKLR